MKWNVNKCTVLWSAHIMLAPQLSTSGHIIKNDKQAEYLGISASVGGTTSTASFKRIKEATAMLHILKRKWVHSGATTSQSLLQMWNTYVLTKATYGLHLVPCSTELENEWSKLDKITMINFLGCFSENFIKRLRPISRQLSLSEQREVQMASLESRITRRSKEVDLDDSARGDQLD